MSLRSVVCTFIAALTLASCSPAPKPQTPAPKPDSHDLHNLFTVTPTITSGSGPETDAAFDELKSMGVRTIISVDGAAPDVARASARAMRYVHIPVTYSEITPEQQTQLARAVRDLPKPIYIHCHHGKHRGPAAAASVAILLNQLTPEAGVAFLKEAGTSPSYSGLYECVEVARPATNAQLDAAPAEFPSLHRPAGLVAAMVEIDSAYTNLGLIRDAGWTTPIDHPDLVPAAEAGRMADHLRLACESGDDGRGPDLVPRMRAAAAVASTLEEALVYRAPSTDLESRWTPVVESCKGCHKAYRDTFTPSR